LWRAPEPAPPDTWCATAPTTLRPRPPPALQLPPTALCSSPWPLSWNEIFSRCTGRSAGKCSGPAECLLRSVQIALLLEHHAERVVSFGVVRFQCNSCGKLPKSGLQIPLLGPYQSQIEVTRRVVGIDAQGRIKLFSGVVDCSLLAQSDSQVVVGIH